MENVKSYLASILLRGDSGGTHNAHYPSFSEAKRALLEAYQANKASFVAMSINAIDSTSNPTLWVARKKKDGTIEIIDKQKR